MLKEYLKKQGTWTKKMKRDIQEKLIELNLSREELTTVLDHWRRLDKARRDGRPYVVFPSDMNQEELIAVWCKFEEDRVVHIRVTGTLEPREYPDKITRRGKAFKVLQRMEMEYAQDLINTPHVLRQYLKDQGNTWTKEMQRGIQEKLIELKLPLKELNAVLTQWRTWDAARRDRRPALFTNAIKRPNRPGHQWDKELVAASCMYEEERVVCVRVTGTLDPRVYPDGVQGPIHARRHGGRNIILRGQAFQEMEKAEIAFLKDLPKAEARRSKNANKGWTASFTDFWKCVCCCGCCRSDDGEAASSEDSKEGAGEQPEGQVAAVSAPLRDDPGRLQGILDGRDSSHDSRDGAARRERHRFPDGDDEKLVLDDGLASMYEMANRDDNPRKYNAEDIAWAPLGNETKFAQVLVWFLQSVEFHRTPPPRLDLPPYLMRS